jgi:tetratricopeptide (TPR) repeat protein
MLRRPATATSAAAAFTAILLLTSCGDDPAPSPPYTPATSQSPDPAALRRLRNLGRLHFERESEEGYLAAVDSLRQAAALPGSDFDDRLNLARALLSAQDGAEEADRTLRALESDLPPQSRPAELDYAAGLARKRLEDLPGARECFARVTEKRPRHRHGWLQLGRVAFLQNDFAAADAAFLRALDIDPQLRAAAYHRVMIAERTGRPAAETAAARKTFESIPEAGQPDAERCDLTRVTLRPARRPDTEPPEAALTFEDATARLLGPAPFTGLRDLVVVPTDGAREALWLLSASAVVSVAPNSVPRPVAGGGGARLLAGDVDNDGRLDAVVLRDGSFTVAFDALGPAPAPVEIPAASATLDALLVDLDHDGDLDVVRARADGPTAAAVDFHRHNGDRTFAPPVAVASAPRDASARFRTDFHDVDQGNDVDLVLPGSVGPQVALNRRNGAFAPAALDAATSRPAVVARAEDVNGDGAPDLVVGGPQGATVHLNGDVFGERGAFRVGSSWNIVAAGPFRDLALEDVDLDGDLDFLCATDSGAAVGRNRAGSAAAPLAALAFPGPVDRIAPVDLDGDGAAEIAVLGSDGSLRVFARRATPAYAGWTVRPEGRQDNRGAVGAVVEQMCGRLYASAMIKGPAGVRFGLGPAGRAAIDGLRLRFPQGVIQALIGADVGLGADGVARFLQREGLVASCPFLYARGPRGVEFLTDVVGIAPLDEWLPPGATPTLDPEEFVRIDDSALDVSDGRVVLHVTEELRETTYLDRVELVAVEHPADVELHLDESTRQGAYDPLVVYARRRGSAVAPASVLLPGGVDATASAASVDRDYVRGYPQPLSQWPGWVGRYDVEIATAAPATALYLTGRIAWYDSTTAYALHQSGRTFGPLRLDHILPDGTAKTLIPDLGVPAGMDRTMVAHWPNVLPAGTRLRLSGAHRFLWDRIATAETIERVAFHDDPTDPQADAVTTNGAPRLPAKDRPTDAHLTDGRPLRRRPAPLQSATLGFHGFSPPIGDRAQHGQSYDFASAAPDDAFPRATGFATRYGDVLPLLTAHDDRLAILVAGDAVALTFQAPPAPPPATTRTWFLRVSGWAKESGFHNQTGRDIAPLPYRSMTRYPASASDLQTGDPIDHPVNYCTRVVK